MKDRSDRSALAAVRFDSGDRPESLRNLTGATKYLDDLPEAANLLHAAVVPSPSGHGRRLRVDASKARELDPSVLVLLADSIPGENQMGTAVDDEPLLAEGEWHYAGQPVALVLASSKRLARAAAALVRVTGEELPVVTDPREAFAKGQLILKPRVQSSGDLAAAFRTEEQGGAARWIVEGRAESGGQEHVYLETQGAIAEPVDGGLRLISGTQAPSGVQKAVARVLGIPMRELEVEALRLGGAFGGKEDQAAPWAALAALGAWVTGRPVKLVLSRRDDLRMTGKRHPYSTDFRLALDAEGKFLGLELDFYQNAGAACDLSPAIIARSLYHAAGAYRIPAVRAAGYMCRTNLPPFTAFRGFGAPQAIWAMEAAVSKAAEATGIPALELQRRNLLREGDLTHYGMKMEDCRAGRAFELLLSRNPAARLKAEIDDFNAAHGDRKRGSWVIPLAFGVSFTKLMMNQGGALVHVFNDGSVSVSTGAVEMGQGVGRKVLVVAARTLGVPENLVRIERTRTATVANTMPTAASTGSDINGAAALAACEEIRKRLLAFAATVLGAPEDELSLGNGLVLRGGRDAGLAWKDLVAKAHEARVDLSAHGFYATPGLFYDMKAERGSPFAYHVYGAALVVAELDTLRGSSRIVRADLVHDGGVPIDALVDRGQIEGAFAQGLGWAILEDLVYGKDGKLLSDTLSTYKLPDMKFMDFPIDIELLDDAANAKAVLGSKAVGEPPFQYGIAGYFAVLEALKAARPGAGGFFDLPLTQEKALRFLDGGN